MTLADRIAILDKGESQHCAPLDAYHNPANDFVRSFCANTLMIWLIQRIRCSSNLNGGPRVKTVARFLIWLMILVVFSTFVERCSRIIAYSLSNDVVLVQGLCNRGIRCCEWN